MPHRRVSLDARLLGSRSRRILLDSGFVGCASASWSALDAGLLGIRRRGLWLACWLLGPHVGFYGGINYGFGYGGVLVLASQTKLPRVCVAFFADCLRNLSHLSPYRRLPCRKRGISAD